MIHGRTGIHVIDALETRRKYFMDILGDLFGEGGRLSGALTFSAGDEKDLARLSAGDRVPALILAPCDVVFPGGLMERFQARGLSPKVFCYDERLSFERVMSCFDRGVIDVFAIPTNPSVLRAKAYRLLCDGLISRDELESLPDLTMKEYRIIRALGTAPGGRLPRSGLVRSVWPDLAVSPKTIDVHIFNLRRKLRCHGFDIVTQLDNGRMLSLQRVPGAGQPPLTGGESAR